MIRFNFFYNISTTPLRFVSVNYCITENYRGETLRVTDSYPYLYNKVKTLALQQPDFLTYCLTWEHRNTACYTVNIKEDQ